MTRKSIIKEIKPNISLMIRDLEINKNRHLPNRCVICKKNLRKRNHTFICSNCRSKYQYKDWFKRIIYELKRRELQ